MLLAGLAPPLLNGIDFDPLLPAGTAQLLQRVPMGTSLKYSLVYAAPWWRELGFLGKIVVADGRETYASLCLDNSPESWRRGVLSCFVEGDGLCANQPVSWDVGAKLQNSLARSNRSRFG